MSNEISGARSYLVIAPEVTWGTSPGSPAYIHLPTAEYGVVMQRDRRNAALFTGIRSRHHGKSFRGMPSGRLNIPWYGWEPPASTTCLAQTLLDWAFNLSDPQNIIKPSYLAEWAEGPDIANVRHNGLRVNNCELSGSADSGNVMIGLDLMGKTESALVTAQTLPTERNKCVEAEFTDCDFQLNGSPIDLESFSFKLADNLKAKYLGSTSPAHLTAGDRILSLTMVPVKNADTWSAYQRAFAEVEMTGQISIQGLHNGTGASGTMRKLVIDFNRLSLINPDEQRNRDALNMQPLNFDCLKPQASSNEVTFTWSLV